MATAVFIQHWVVDLSTISYELSNNLLRNSNNLFRFEKNDSQIRVQLQVPEILFLKNRRFATFSHFLTAYRATIFINVCVSSQLLFVYFNQWPKFSKIYLFTNDSKMLESNYIFFLFLTFFFFFSFTNMIL